MPARHDTVPLLVTQATPLSDGPVASFRGQLGGIPEAFIQATATNVAPTNRGGAVRVTLGEIWASDLSVAQIFPGITSGSAYIWAFADADNGSFSVSHG